MKNPSARSRDDGRAAKRLAPRFAWRSAEWLDDEVAIDFPSLDEAVERMFDAFLAPVEETAGKPDLSAELRLSAREAFQGVTVPFDVPVRKICAECGGRGEVWSDPCVRCDGAGHRLANHPVRFVVPPRVQHGERFSVSIAFPLASPTRVEVLIAIHGY
jgi:DnaJ-class molecular chaperone